MYLLIEHTIFYISLAICTAIIAVALHGLRKSIACCDTLWKYNYAIAIFSALLLSLTLIHEHLENQSQYQQCSEQTTPHTTKQSPYVITVSSDAHLFPPTHFTAIQHGKEFL